MHFIVLPVAIVFGAIGPLKHTFSVLFAAEVLPVVERPIWPLFFSVTFLLIFIPAPFISGAFRVKIFTFSVRFVTNPLTLVNVTVSENESAEPFGFILEPKSFKLRAIGPNLKPISLFSIRIIVPLPRVNLAFTQTKPIFEAHFESILFDLSDLRAINF